MIISKLALLGIAFVVEYYVIQGGLEYFDKKKYAESDKEFEQLMASLSQKTTRDEVL